MSIEFKTNFDLKKQAQEIRARIKAELEKATLDAAAEIKHRTEDGVDVDGTAFDPYTRRYAAYKYGSKSKGGREMGGFAAKSKTQAFKQGLTQSKKYSNFGKVNLHLTGRMLESIQVKVVREAGGWLARLVISGFNAVKARGAMEGYKNHNPKKVRKFFALSDSQKAQIAERIKRAINGR